MRVVVIVNPVAGGRRRSLPVDDRVRLVRDALARHGADGRVVLTERPGHAPDLARRAVQDGADIVVAWGGDGTINEVASQLVGTRAVLGIVRAGSGNGMARELRIPAAPDAALDAALAGRARSIDTGEIEGRPFFNVAGIGFDAAMAAEFNRLGCERRGTLLYGLRVARAALGYRANRYLVEVGSHRVEARALVVAIANFPQYGSGAVIAPAASPDDGAFDVVVAEERGAFGRLALVFRALARSIDRAPGVTTMRGAGVVVTADGPIGFHVDGEPHEGGPVVRAGLRPSALRVMAPRGA